MHKHMSYDKERSEEIFVNVRGMMRLISTKVREKE